MFESQVIFLVGMAVLLPWWIFWHRTLTRPAAFAADRSAQIPLLVALPLSLVLLFISLRTHAARDVRDDGFQLIFCLVAGAVWIALCARAFRWLGLDARLDVGERGNAAAGFALAGGVLGLASLCAGSSAGEGPWYGCDLFCTALSTAVWAGLWALLEGFVGFSEEIAVERNTRAGLLLGGYLAGTGVLLGAAVAGDWDSVSGTALDLVRFGWPALPLAAAAYVLEKTGRRADRSLPGTFWFLGVLPALALPTSSMAFVFTRGFPR